MIELTSTIDATMGGLSVGMPSIQSSAIDGTGQWMPVGPVRTDSGISIDAHKALGHGVLWQAVNILGGDLGQLPLRRMRQENGGTFKAAGDPVDNLVRFAPNAWQTPSVWKETMMVWAALWGQGISGIVREGTTPVALVPFLPDRTGYERLDDGSYVIITRLSNGREIAVSPEDTIHIRGLATNGFWGLSVVEVAKNVIGHGLALQEHGNATFRNHARPSGVLKHKGQMKAEARQHLRDEWQKLHAGASSAGKVAVLWDDMEFQALSMSNEDSQWLEGRRLDREFIASLFNLPAFKLNALENSAVRSNLEEQNRDYFNTSLSRWMNRFSEECFRKLLTEQEQKSGKHFFKWFPEAFLRGDIEKRYRAYAVGRVNEFLSANDVRELEDLNPIEGGDEYNNPAINPADTREAVAEVENLLQGQVQAMLSAEASALTREAKSARNFTEWVDGFYAKYIEFASPYLRNACRVYGSLGRSAPWQDVCRGRAGRMKADIVQTLGEIKAGELAGEVSSIATSVRTCGSELTRQILGGDTDG